MLSFLTLFIRRSDRIFSGGGPTSGSSLSARSGGCLPSSTCGPTLPMSVGLSSQSFSGFRVDPEPISVLAASVKVAGVNRPVHNHAFHRCLPYFSLFHDPNALRTEVLLQPWNGWQAYAFPLYVLLSAILLKAPLVLWGPQSPWFPELLDLVVDDSVALPLDRDLLSQLQVQ